MGAFAAGGERRAQLLEEVRESYRAHRRTLGLADLEDDQIKRLLLGIPLGLGFPAWHRAVGHVALPPAEAPVALAFRQEAQAGVRTLLAAFPAFRERARGRLPGAPQHTVDISATSVLLQTIEDNAVAVIEDAVVAAGWTPLATAGDAVFALPPGGTPVPDAVAVGLCRRAEDDLRSRLGIALRVTPKPFQAGRPSPDGRGPPPPGAATTETRPAPTAEPHRAHELPAAARDPWTAGPSVPATRAPGTAVAPPTAVPMRRPELASGPAAHPGPQAAPRAEPQHVPSGAAVTARLPSSVATAAAPGLASGVVPASEQDVEAAPRAEVGPAAPGESVQLGAAVFPGPRHAAPDAARTAREMECPHRAEPQYVPSGASVEAGQLLSVAAVAAPGRSSGMVTVAELDAEAAPQAEVAPAVDRLGAFRTVAAAATAGLSAEAPPQTDLGTGASSQARAGGEPGTHYPTAEVGPAARGEGALLGTPVPSGPRPAAPAISGSAYRAHGPLAATRDLRAAGPFTPAIVAPGAAAAPPTAAQNGNTGRASGPAAPLGPQAASRARQQHVPSWVAAAARQPFSFATAAAPGQAARVIPLAAERRAGAAPRAVATPAIGVDMAGVSPAHTAADQNFGTSSVAADA